MKDIRTLIPDIYKLVGEQDGNIPLSVWNNLGEDISIRLREQHQPRLQSSHLRLSQMGSRCPCALWHSIHRPEMGEALPPWAQIKYAYGHVLEAYAIALAKAAGHTVEGEQSYVEVDGVPGHRDCIIDGYVVDVKSCSSRSFVKFKDGTLAQDDPFGYLEQLDGYLCGSADDPLVIHKDVAFDWAIDKTLGHMCLYEHHLREENIRRRIADYKNIVKAQVAPACNCGTVAEGKSGNLRLDTRASYSAFKYCCFPNLRTFLYASGPVYLTKVERKPDVVEIDKHGKMVYN